MKTVLATLILSATCYCAAAQEMTTTTPVQKTKKNELGLTTEMDVFSPEFSSTAFQAIQYKRWKNEHFGARFLLGRRDYFSDDNFAASYQVSGDTVTVLRPVTNGSMGILGVGLEAQRHFYKRVHLFAAVEFKFGYGRGTVDTFSDRTVQGDPSNPIPTPPPNPVMPGRTPATTDIFYASVVPTFGAKIQFNRICFGSEMALNLINYTSIKHENKHSVGQLDFDISRINPRLFIHYRF